MLETTCGANWGSNPISPSKWQNHNLNHTNSLLRSLRHLNHLNNSRTLRPCMRFPTLYKNNKRLHRNTITIASRKTNSWTDALIRHLPRATPGNVAISGGRKSNVLLTQSSAPRNAGNSGSKWPRQGAREFGTQACGTGANYKKRKDATTRSETKLQRELSERRKLK